MDLASASSSDNKIAWYKGDGPCTGDSCKACDSGTRLAGDPKTEASQCCVDAYQSAVGATCTAYTEDAQSCNALRRPFIEGTRSQDAACAEPCDQVTEFAQGLDACVHHHLRPGPILTGGSNNTQRTASPVQPQPSRPRTAPKPVQHAPRAQKSAKTKQHARHAKSKHTTTTTRAPLPSALRPSQTVTREHSSSSRTERPTTDAIRALKDSTKTRRYDRTVQTIQHQRNLLQRPEQEIDRRHRTD